MPVVLTEKDINKVAEAEAFEALGHPFDDPDTDLLRQNLTCATKPVWECMEDPSCDFEVGQGCTAKKFDEDENTMSNYEWGLRKYHAFYKDRPAPVLEDKYRLARTNPGEAVVDDVREVDLGAPKDDDEDLRSFLNLVVGGGGGGGGILSPVVAAVPAVRKKKSSTRSRSRKKKNTSRKGQAKGGAGSSPTPTPLRRSSRKKK